MRRLRELRGARFNLRDLNARLSGTANVGSGDEPNELGIWDEDSRQQPLPPQQPPEMRFVAEESLEKSCNSLEAKCVDARRGRPVRVKSIARIGVFVLLLTRIPVDSLADCRFTEAFGTTVVGSLAGFWTTDTGPFERVDDDVVIEGRANGAGEVGEE